MGATVRGANGPLGVRELVLCELSLAVVAAGVVGGSPWLVPAALLAFAGLALGLLRRRGRGACEWLAAAVSFRSRVRRRDSGYGVHDLFGMRGMRAYAYEDRGRRVVGMVGDGTFLTAVVRVEADGAGLRPAGTGLRPAGGARELPLSLLADALEVDGVVLASAQLVQRVQQVRGVASPGEVSPALRQTWVALRLEPERCAEAVAARGGGLGGAQRCLVRAADQVASRIAGAGLRAEVLDQEGIGSAAAAAGAAGVATANIGAAGAGAVVGAAGVGAVVGDSGGGSAESSRVWRGGGLLHTAYAVAGAAADSGALERAVRAVRLLSASAGRTTTVGLSVRRGASWRALEVSGHVRVSCRNEGELVAARRELEQVAREAGVGLVRLDREQLPGVLATLPLGGTR
ncbi:type VII secretion protein EccE [Streptomyces sp. NPDC048442]|uniref:type VII secretion protein EccE n=1 Tax=Streptomyces sp. NPDC048442 TaxID=3154823 RepID=UPI00343BA0F3